MAEPTIQLGGGNWAGKTDNLLGYYEQDGRFYKQDFTFSRSTTGTYTDSDGYIQEMPYNLLTYSNDFSNSAWIKDRCTLTSGQSGYDGSNDAWLIQSTATAQSSRCYQAFNSDGNFNRSVYAKKGTSDYLAIYTTSSAYAYFNLSNGTIGTESNNVNASILSVGNGWYRCSVTMSNVYNNHYIFVANVDNNTSTNSGDNIYIQDAQINKGSSAKTYFPTTTRLNMPRVDYKDNSNGSLILEPQRTNLFAYSEDFSQSFWNKASSSVTLTSQIAPNGTSNSVYNLVGTSANLYAGGVTGVQHTISFYIKSNGQEKDKFKLRLGNNTSVEYTATNEWVRYEYTETPTTSVFGITTTSAPNNEFDLLVWGGQSEQGSYATSLINTSGSSVTRNADACELTNVADRIGQTEGASYFEYTCNGSDGSGQRIFSLRGSSTSNRIAIFDQLGKIRIFVASGGAVQVDSTTNVDTASTHKVAFRYKLNDFKLYIDGAAIVTDTAFTVPTLNSVYVGTSEGFGGTLGGNVKDVRVYNTALSDSELATLTT